MRRAMVMAICVAMLGLGAAPAPAAFDDPLTVIVPQPTDQSPVPPLGYLDGPCGLAATAGAIYVSDYYHRSIDVFSLAGKYLSQPLSAWGGAANPHTGPVDDPCGLALDSSGALYVNDYHREVVRFGAPASLGGAEVLDTGDPTDPLSNPTGVAVDPETDHVFVNDRTYVAEYDTTGSIVGTIGEGSLQNGYGIAASGFPDTAGQIYVPDAADDTVKVYDPSFSTTIPKATITGPPAGFGSLRDSAVAVDDSTGELYVVDTLGPQLTEEPWAVVYVFASDGSFEGRLKHVTVNAAPVGLAVDNSGTATQGRVYLTSGISEDAGIYVYPPGAATGASEPSLGLAVGSDASSGSARPFANAGQAHPTSTTQGARAQSGVAERRSSPRPTSRMSAKYRRHSKHRRPHAGRHRLR